MRTLEHCARAGKACARHQGGAQPGLRGPSGMHALGPRALGQIFDDPARHAARDAERIDGLALVEPQRDRNARGGTHCAEHRGWVEARSVHGLRHDKAQPAQHLDADGNALERRGTIRIVPLAGGQHRRRNHSAGVHRPALESVVEILAMRRRAVH